MTSILSAISGVFSKALILGAVLPMVVFVLLSYLLLLPLLPPDLLILNRLASLSPEWNVISFAFVTLILSGLLYNLNIPIIQLYEGYPWLNSRFGKRRVDHYVARFSRLFYQRDAIDLLQQVTSDDVKAQPDIPSTATPGSGSQSITVQQALLKRLTAMGAFPEKMTEDERWTAVWERVDAQRHTAYLSVVEEFPNRTDLILPTRLGNKIRSFEYYSDREYGMDSIQLWPRLIAKIDKDYAASIDDAKVSFDFMLNNSLLTAILAFLLIALGLGTGSALASANGLVWWVVKIAVLIAASYLFYLFSIERAGAWGSMIKGAFDLYRHCLLKQLGYPMPAPTRQAEREFWSKISLQMLIGDPLDGSLREIVTNAPPEQLTFVRCEPAGLKLTVARGAQLSPAENDLLSIVLSVKNIDTQIAKNVILTDSVPPGFEFDWGKGTSPAMVIDQQGLLVRYQEVRFEGVNPHHFMIGTLEPGNEIFLMYRQIKINKK